MAGFKERISLLIDVDHKGATSGMKAFGTSIRGVDGTINKFKAGASSAMDSVKANAGTMALAAGASLVAFGVKALGAFTDVAMGARDLGAATGLAVEDASRWIAVADDMGISAADLTAGLGAVTKTLDDDKWAKYGIATRDAAGEARDANDILLDTFDLLSEETNLTERARLGKELLGKGYASLAPLIGKSRDEYEKMLGAVEKGQVITEKEAGKAQRMALAQDALSDALNEVTLAAGEMVAEMAPTIEMMSDAVTTALEWKEALGPIPELIKKVASPIDAGIGVVDWMKTGNSMTLDYTLTLEEFTKSMEDFGASAELVTKQQAEWHKINGASTKSTNVLADALDNVEDAADDAAQAAIDSAAAFREQRDAAYEAASSMWDVEEATLQVTDKYNEYVEKVAGGEATLSELRQDQIDLAQGFAGIAAQTAEATGVAADSEAGVRTQISTLKDLQAQFPALRDEIQKYINKLLAIPRSVSTSVGFVGPGTHATVGGMGQYASGTSSARAGVALVGEEGPELVMMRGGETVIPAGQTASMLSGGGAGVGGGAVTYNFHITGVTGEQVIAAAKAYERQNGPGWRQ